MNIGEFALIGRGREECKGEATRTIIESNCRRWNATAEERANRLHSQAPLLQLFWKNSKSRSAASSQLTALRHLMHREGGEKHRVRRAAVSAGLKDVLATLTDMHEDDESCVMVGGSANGCVLEALSRGGGRIVRDPMLTFSRAGRRVWYFLGRGCIRAVVVLVNNTECQVQYQY